MRPLYLASFQLLSSELMGDIPLAMDCVTSHGFEVLGQRSRIGRRIGQMGRGKGSSEGPRANSLFPGQMRRGKGRSEGPREIRSSRDRWEGARGESKGPGQIRSSHGRWEGARGEAKGPRQIRSSHGRWEGARGEAKGPRQMGSAQGRCESPSTEGRCTLNSNVSSILIHVQHITVHNCICVVDNTIEQ